MSTVLITGANRGIGLELTRGYAADGWRVMACCRHPDKARALKDLGAAITLHRLDVTDGLQVAGLARALADTPIDVLINNAGIMGARAGFGATDYDVFAEVLRVNTLAPLRMAERFAKHVAASERRTIVNISSVLGSIAENGSGGNTDYRASKAALNMVTRGLAAELGERGIIAISIHPGWVRTDMGGTEAPVPPADSAAGIRRVIAGLGPEDSGRFFAHDGSTLPW